MSFWLPVPVLRSGSAPAPAGAMYGCGHLLTDLCDLLVELFVSVKIHNQ